MRYWKEHGQELLIVESSFRTDESVTGSSFEPNHTYTGWQWRLVRTQDKAGWRSTTGATEPLLVATVDALAARKGSRGSAASKDAADDRSAGIC